MSAMPAVRGLKFDGVIATPRITIEAISRPARTFTGDFYFAQRHGDRLWIALGDVAGKGLPAAIIMAMIQEELEHRITSCATAECDPARTAQRLHEFLEPLLPSSVCGLRELLRRSTAPGAVLESLATDDDVTIVVARRE